MKHTTFAAPHPPPLLINLCRPCSSNHLLFLHAHRLLSSLHFMRCCIAFGSATTPRRSTLVFLVYSCVLLANLWSPSRLPACLPPFRVTYLAFTSPAVGIYLKKMYASLLTSPSVSVFLYFLCCTLGPPSIVTKGQICRMCFASLAT